MSALDVARIVFAAGIMLVAFGALGVMHHRHTNPAPPAEHEADSDFLAVARALGVVRGE